MKKRTANLLKLAAAVVGGVGFVATWEYHNQNARGSLDRNSVERHQRQEERMDAIERKITSLHPETSPAKESHAE